VNNFKRYTRCVLPETHEAIVFGDHGVCNICRQNEYKQTTINLREKR